MCHRIVRSIFVIDFIECVQYCIGMFISWTGEIMLSLSLISHCSEPLRIDVRFYLCVE